MNRFWPECLLGEAITLQRGFDLPERDRIQGSVPIVSSSGVTGFHDTAKVKAPGVVTGRYGTLGEIHFVTDDFWPLNTTLYVKDFKGNHPRYISYFLRTLNFASQNSAGAVPGVNRNHLHQIKVAIPPLEIQCKIAAILSAYDDLIENNTRRIAILESMAKAIYREWFVEFRFPGHENVKLVDSPLGKIPEGWKQTELKHRIEIKHGCAFQGSHFSTTPTSRVLTTPGNFAAGGGFKIGRMKYYNEDGPLDASYVLRPMDLIVTMTDLSKESDTLGFPAFVPRTSGTTFLHNQRIGRVIPVSGHFSRSFYYCVFCDASYRHHVVGAATGLSVKHTSPSRILAYSRLMPESDDLISRFGQTAEPMFQEINCLGVKIEKLRQTRELLLPKLISGQLDVEDLDIEIGTPLVEAEA